MTQLVYRATDVGFRQGLLLVELAWIIHEHSASLADSQ